MIIHVLFFNEYFLWHVLTLRLRASHPKYLSGGPLHPDQVKISRGHLTRLKFPGADLTRVLFPRGADLTRILGPNW